MPFQTKSDQIAKLRGTADQMRHHLKVDRMVMSKTIAEIVNYCNHMAAEDPLIFPVKDNPFKDKKSCAILWCVQTKFCLLFIPKFVIKFIDRDTSFQDIVKFFDIVQTLIDEENCNALGLYYFHIFLQGIFSCSFD